MEGRVFGGCEGILGPGGQSSPEVSKGSEHSFERLEGSLVCRLRDPKSRTHGSRSHLCHTTVGVMVGMTVVGSGHGIGEAQSAWGKPCVSGSLPCPLCALSLIHI